MIFPFRPEYYKIPEVEMDGEVISTTDLMQAIFAKHRNGALGIRSFYCDVKTNKFWGLGQTKIPMPTIENAHDFFKNNTSPDSVF